MFATIDEEHFTQKKMKTWDSYACFYHYKFIYITE